MRRIGSVFFLMALGLAAGSAPALAQGRAYAAPPLTIHPRSFLDPGVIAPVGSENSYVWAVTQPHDDLMEQGFGRSKFGNETLPGQFLPGRPEALIHF